MLNDELEILNDYKRAAANLRYLKANKFKLGSKVFVNHDRYIGEGFVSYSDSCPVDSLAVRLDNNSVWHYPLENVEPR